LIQGSSAFGSMQDLAISFGVFTALVAAILLGFQRNYKRMLAYSSMENMGVILVGFALGGIGAIGALVQIIAHAFAKSSAFYESGNIVAAYESKNISDVQGLIRRLRNTGYLFVLSCLSVTGAPPFGVFVGEFFILIQAINTGNYVVAGLLAFAYIYAFIGLNRQSVQMVFGQETQVTDATEVSGASDAKTRTVEESKTAISPVHEATISIVIPFANLAISLIIGIYMIPAILNAAAAWGA
jgi:hydrogenase-4 component F